MNVEGAGYNKRKNSLTVAQENFSIRHSLFDIRHSIPLSADNSVAGQEMPFLAGHGIRILLTHLRPVEKEVAPCTLVGSCTKTW